MQAELSQPRRPWFRSLAAREALSGYLFILPAVLGFLAFTAGPMGFAAWVSTTDWDMLTPPIPVGLGNFETMLNDALFWQSLRVTFLYAILSVPLIQVVGFAIASLLNVKVRGLAIFRTIYYLPTVAPVVATSVLWTWIFNTEFGLLNALLRQVGLPKVLWLQDPRWALPVLVTLAVWGFGGTMVVYLAGLQGIPVQLYEAAEIDGARAWEKLVNITIPMLSPVIFFNSLLALIFSLQAFAQAQIITNGGPANSTLLFSLYLYRRAFTDFKMGYAAALAWTMFLILLVISVGVVVLFSRRVYYEDEGR